jgi:hypothetical protein
LNPEVVQKAVPLIVSTMDKSLVLRRLVVPVSGPMPLSVLLGIAAAKKVLE